MSQTTPFRRPAQAERYQHKTRRPVAGSQICSSRHGLLRAPRSSAYVPRISPTRSPLVAFELPLHHQQLAQFVPVRVAAVHGPAPGAPLVLRARQQPRAVVKDVLHCCRVKSFQAFVSVDRPGKPRWPKDVRRRGGKNARGGGGGSVVWLFLLTSHQMRVPGIRATRGYLSNQPA